MDKVECVVVGAGPAGSACALSLAREGIETVLVERGDRPGAKNVASFVLFTPVLEKLIPEFRDDAPLERLISDHAFAYLGPNDLVQLRFRFGRFIEEEQAYTAYRSKFDYWLAEKAREAGAELLTNVLVTDLLVRNGRVAGIKVGDEELEADVVVGADGIHTVVGRKAGLVADDIRTYLLGIKEVLDLPPEVIEERFQMQRGQGICYEMVGYPVDDVLGAVRRYQVQTLLIDRHHRVPGWRCLECGWVGLTPVDSCPACGVPTREIADAVGEIVRLAILQNGQVEVGENIPVLHELGEVAGVLRYS